MPEPAIAQYTEQIAREIAQEMEGNRGGELRVWMQLAHQRESLVSQLYRVSSIDERLRATPDHGPATVIRSALAGIWAHEESHTRFLSSIRSLSEPAPLPRELLQQLETRVTSIAAADGHLARALIVIGASLGRVPELAVDLQRMNLRQLLELFGELESTTRMGYERILELGRGLRCDAETARDFGYTFVFDVARILAEERFHEDVFAAMVRWVAEDGASLKTMQASVCASILYDLADHHLSSGAVRRIVDPALPAVWAAESGQDWISDGGLGWLFREHALVAPVAGGETTRALLGI